MIKICVYNKDMGSWESVEIRQRSTYILYVYTIKGGLKGGFSEENNLSGNIFIFGKFSLKIFIKISLKFLQNFSKVF